MSWPERILFLSSDSEDYLADGILHGLKTLMGDRVVDFPKSEHVYSTYPSELRGSLYGHGFSLYARAPDPPVVRTRIRDHLAQGRFDLVIISNVHRLAHELVRLYSLLRAPLRVAILDGEDRASRFPRAQDLVTDPRLAALRFQSSWRYFKREWDAAPERPIDRVAQKTLLAPPDSAMRPIAFSIPDDVILTDAELDSPRDQDFPHHIVDSALAAQLGRPTKYAFDDEADYHRDLSRSRFGITTQRAGWDCLRHYEVAARGAIPCFRDLDRKPARCAPHGLGPDNSVTYRDPADLLAKVARLSPEEEVRLRRGAVAWARRNSTVMRARALLDAMQS